MPERIAVVVCHGMGQQVAFETLSSVATSVGAQLGIPTEKINTELVSNGDRYLARAELTVGDREVHFFESYWAPLVEGKVTLFDTLRFLVESGLTGVRFALTTGEFDRWMFNRQHRFEIPARRVYQFAIAVWVVVLLTAAYVAYGAAAFAAVTQIFRIAPSGTPRMTMFLAAATVLIWTAAASAVIGAALAVAWVLVLHLTRMGTRVHVSTDPGRSVRSNLVLRLASLLFAIVLVLHELQMMRNRRWPILLAWSYRDHLQLRALLMLLVLGGLLYLVGSFLVGFIGDVAAYVSPYKVSKFQEIRSAIQAVGRGVTQHVYSAVTDSGTPLYDSVCVVGHSLGSVVAYDCLNDALARDARRGGWSPDSPVGALDVASRTRLLLTFGSPLDKTAFVFRTQTPPEPTLRERLAAHVQPLILHSPARATIRWVNIWSRMDWISGSLEYYDEGDQRTGNRVASEADVRNLHTWSTHTGYWKHSLMPSVIAEAITGTERSSPLH